MPHMAVLGGKDSHWHEEVDHPFAGLERWGRGLLYGLLRFAVAEPKVSGAQMSGVKRLLIVKEPYRMGDLFQITPALRALKSQFPELYVGLAIQDRNLPVFASNPNVDKIHLYEKKRVNRNPLRAVAFIREIRSVRYDCAVTLETERAHLTNDLIAWMSGASLRARYDSSSWDGGRSNAFYNCLVPWSGTESHQVERNFGPLRALGCELRDPSLEFHVPQGDRDAARRLLAEKGIGPSQAHIAIHPGAYKLKNRWPLERYLEVARRWRQSGGTSVFTLGPSEREWKDQIEKEGFAVVADAPLAVVAGVLSLSRRILCNDTGILHVAGGLGVPTLALFAETDPAQWKPPGEQVRHLRAPDRNIESIPVEAVWNELTQKS